MIKYKGYYIDNVYFHSRAEIDEFVRQQAARKYKQVVKLQLSYDDPEMILAAEGYADSLARSLVQNHGYSWEEVEALEMSIYDE